MAESIVRLRVESQEFEQKLKRASQELLAMAENARRTGATFAIADKEELAFVASLGQLQTSARSAKGTIAEMTKAFQDLSVHYRSLTAEEKAAPYGRELKKSLEQLQQRIVDSKSSLNEINSAIGESKKQTDMLSGAVNDLTGKFGLNLPKLGALSVGLGAATTALKVAKDAFFANEQQLDEWGRSTESAKSLYNGFLDALNTGDISGYLSRINEIVNAARAAYDALDELGTYNAFNQVNSSRNRQQLTNAIADYREGIGSKSAIGDASRAVIGDLKDLYLKQQGAYVAAINKLAAERGVSGKALMQIANGSYSNYEKAKAVQMTGERYITHTNQYGNAYTTVEKYAKDAAEAMGAALRRINDTDWQELQKLGADAQNTLNEIGQTRRMVARAMGRGSSTASGGGGVAVGGGGSSVNLDALAFKVDDKFDGGMLPEQATEQLSVTMAKAMSTLISDSIQKTDPEKLKSMMQTNTRGDIFAGADRSIVQEKKQGGGDQTMGKIAKGLGALGQITGALQNMGVKLPDGVTKTIGVMQSLISIVQGVQTVISIFATGSQTANTVAVGLNTAAVSALTTAMAINTATGFIPFFAHGGVARAANGFVGGNSYSGDLMPVAVNSGELILNRAQQGNLASQLSGGAMGAIEVYGRISGEDIELASRRRARRKFGTETTNNR